MRMKLYFCKAVQCDRGDIGLLSRMDLISNAAPPFPGCVTLHKSLCLSEPQFLLLTNRNNNHYLRLVVRIQYINAKERAGTERREGLSISISFITPKASLFDIYQDPVCRNWQKTQPQLA